MTLLVADTARATLSPVIPGHFVPTGHFTHRSDQYRLANRTTTIEEFVLNSQQARNLRVFDMVSLVTGKPYRSYDIKDAADAIPAIVLVDAGSAGTVGGIPRSIGLIVSGGRVVAPLSSSRFGTGLLCISRSGKVEVLWSRSYNANSCWNSVQSGPLLIEPGGRLGIYPNEVSSVSRHHHSILAIEKNGTVHLMYTSASYMYDIAKYLYQGNKYDAAINLGADGAIIANDPPLSVSYGDSGRPVAASIGVARQ